MQQNNLISLANLVAGVQKSRAQLNQIGYHTAIQMTLESNAHKLNLLTWAEFLSSFPNPPSLLPHQDTEEMGGAEIKMNLHLNQPGR